MPGEYTLIVEGWSSGEGAYTLATSCGAPIVSEGDLMCGSSVDGDTSGAASVVGSASGEHFYRLTVPLPREYTFSTCDGVGHDTILRLFAGGHLEANSTQVAANDDACPGFKSRITMQLLPGVYTVIVEGYSTSEGVYTLSTSCGPLPNPFACALCTEPGSCLESEAVDGVCPDACPAATTPTTMATTVATTVDANSVDASSASDDSSASTTMIVIIVAAVAVCLMLVVFGVSRKRGGVGGKDDGTNTARNFENPTYDTGGGGQVDGFGFQSAGDDSGYLDVAAASE